MDFSDSKSFVHTKKFCRFLVTFVVFSFVFGWNIFSHSQIFAQQGTTDLSIIMEGPAEAGHYENFTYTVKVTNGGPDAAPGAKFRNQLFAGAENIEVKCAVIQGNASCPGESEILIANNVITTTIPTFDNNSQVQFLIKGRYPYLPPTSVKNEATISVPDGMAEANAKTNTAITNTKLNIKPADVVTENSEFVFETQEDHREFEKNNFAETIFFTDDSRAKFKFTIKNNGPGIVLDVPISPELYLWQTRYLTLKNINITCEAAGGALCPEYLTT